MKKHFIKNTHINIFLFLKCLSFYYLSRGIFTLIMFYKINRHLPDKKHFILTSLNKLLDKKLKKYSSFFKSLTYKTENAFHYVYYFHISLTNFVLNKKEIYSVINEN